MTMIEEGKAAPDFSLIADDGKKIRLSEFKGKKKVVLYFYPKDNTPGCTQESCDFRDAVKKIAKENAVVIGLSADSVKSHESFKKKFELPFPLLSDEGKEVLQKYGVWKEKSLYGRKFMGIERTTILIDERGKVFRVFPKVKVSGHVEAVLEALKEAQKTSCD